MSTTVDLKTQLKNLIELQKIDTCIYGLKREKEVKPEELKVIQEAFEQQKLSLAALEKKSLDLQKQKKDHELEVASKEESVKKLQGQLYSLKTNKEYHAMLQQIEDAKADASMIEDKIIGVMVGLDQVRDEIENEKRRLQEEEKNVNERKKSVESRLKEIDEIIAKSHAQRKALEPTITPNILAQYERILNSRDGLAIVHVKDNSCAGCNMFVPPQVINLIRMYDRIVTCEVCNRILFIEDEDAAA
jgi:hypothetical protein